MDEPGGTPRLQRLAILYHPRRKEAITEAEWLRSELSARGVTAFIGSGWDLDVLESVGEDVDLAVTLGGDGTIIQVARSVSGPRVPVLGVNLGRIGFLAELTRKGLHERVDAIVQHKFWVERRLMLEVTLHSNGGQERLLSLNEAAVSRGASFQAILVAVTVDDVYFMTYTADGVLVATPTGSTAYSLAAGGPIVYPESRDMLMTPVAPHLHVGRSTVFPGSTRVVLELGGDVLGALSVDAVDIRDLLPGDRVEVTASPLEARFARFGPRSYFYGALSDQLHWS